MKSKFMNLFPLTLIFQLTYSRTHSHISLYDIFLNVFSSFEAIKPIALGNIFLLGVGGAGGAPFVTFVDGT